MTQEELLELKQEIDESQDKATKLTARKDLLVEQLKDKWKVTTPKQAKAKLDSMQEDIEELDDKIDKATEELEDKLNEQNNGTQE